MGVSNLMHFTYTTTVGMLCSFRIFVSATSYIIQCKYVKTVNFSTAVFVFDNLTNIYRNSNCLFYPLCTIVQLGQIDAELRERLSCTEKKYDM